MQRQEGSLRLIGQLVCSIWQAPSSLRDFVSKKKMEWVVMEEDILSASGMYLHKSACTTAQAQNHMCVHKHAQERPKFQGPQDIMRANS